MSDTELLARQDALQAQAASVLADLDLFALLRDHRPADTHREFSARADGRTRHRRHDGLPVARPAPIFDLGRSLAVHPRVFRVTYRDDTGRWNTDPRYPDGLYWMVEYVADPNVEWKLDLWFLLEGTTQFDLEHMQTMPGRLTPEIRATIIRI